MQQGDLYETSASLTITETDRLIDALRQLDRCKATLTLVVVNANEEVVGTVTDGDIRRWLLQHGEATRIDLNTVKVREVCTGSLLQFDLATHGSRK